MSSSSLASILVIYKLVDTHQLLFSMPLVATNFTLRFLLFYFLLFSTHLFSSLSPLQFSSIHSFSETATASLASFFPPYCRAFLFSLQLCGWAPCCNSQRVTNCICLFPSQQMAFRRCQMEKEEGMRQNWEKERGKGAQKVNENINEHFISSKFQLVNLGSN